VKLAFDVIHPRVEAIEQKIEELMMNRRASQTEQLAFEVATTTAGGKKDGKAAADGKASSAAQKALKKLQFQRSSNLKKAIETSLHVKDSAKKLTLAPIGQHITALSSQPSSSSSTPAGK
jgi:hypothetical protein